MYMYTYIYITARNMWSADNNKEHF